MSGRKVLPTKTLPHRGCGCSIETALHRYYECPLLSDPELDNEDNTLKRTKWLVPQAKAETQQQPCYWFRGLIPAQPRTDDEPTIERPVVTKGFEEIALKTHSVYTDGGGAPRWVPRACARVGAGAATMNLHKGSPQEPAQITELAVMTSKVPGRQTVPRAETQAVADSWDLIRPETQLDYWIDASYVVNQFPQQLQVGPQTLLADNGDIWQQIQTRAEKKTSPTARSPERARNRATHKQQQGRTRPQPTSATVQ